jgi:hypothetical protein
MAINATPNLAALPNIKYRPTTILGDAQDDVNRRYI